MAKITVALVKELREITGARMMDCKKALVECQAEEIVKGMDRVHALSVLAKEVIEYCAWKEYHSERGQKEITKARKDLAFIKMEYGEYAGSTRWTRKEERSSRARRALNAL